MLRVSARIFEGRLIRRLWDNLSCLPGGRLAFSKTVGLLAPYSGSIGALVMDLGPGRSRVQLRERWRLQNPFQSMHAIALANLGELASGLALMYDLPPDREAIIVRLEIDYMKKARGLITAICHLDVSGYQLDRPMKLQSFLRDEKGDRVAVVTATWLVREGRKRRKEVAASLHCDA